MIDLEKVKHLCENESDPIKGKLFSLLSDPKSVQRLRNYAKFLQSKQPYLLIYLMSFYLVEIQK